MTPFESAVRGSLEGSRGGRVYVHAGDDHATALHHYQGLNYEVWANYRLRMPQLVSCTDADRDALVNLRNAGWRLGIVTNGMVDNQQGKIRSLGLDAFVDGWVISAEVGVRKPSREIFQALALRLGCPLAGWMVGDSPELDIAGGRAVGLRTALITSDQADPNGCMADLVAASVADAAALILADR